MTHSAIGTEPANAPLEWPEDWPGRVHAAVAGDGWAPAQMEAAAAAGAQWSMRLFTPWATWVASRAGMMLCQFPYLMAQNRQARAGITEDHEGRRPLVPAFRDIRAMSFLTDGLQVQPPYDPLEFEIVLTVMEPPLEPLRLLLRRGGVLIPSWRNVEWLRSSPHHDAARRRFRWLSDLGCAFAGCLLKRMR